MWSTTLDEFKDWPRDYKVTKPLAQLCECIETWCDWSNAFSPCHELCAKLLKTARLYEPLLQVKAGGKFRHSKPLDVWTDLGEKLRREMCAWLDDLDQMHHEGNRNTPQEHRKRGDSSCPQIRITLHMNRLYRCHWRDRR